MGDLGLIPGLARCPGEGKGYPPVFWPGEFYGLYSPWGCRIGYNWVTLTLGFLCGSAGKESTCNVGDLGLILGLGRSPGEGKGYPLQYSGLENSMDCVVHGVAKSWT